jgi:citrate synthase
MGSEWETKITKVEPNRLLVRGYRLDELIGKISYASAIYLILRGELPSSKEEEVINAILVASIDHGVTAPSAVTARTVASCGVPITTAMGAGILAIGDHHGGAGEKCIKFLHESLESKKEEENLENLAKRVVFDARNQKKRIAGFGHRFHTNDPRAIKLLEIAERSEVTGKHIKLARMISKELSTQLGRPLPLNVDGAIGAILADMGFQPASGKAFFAISRIAGLTAHILEEITMRPMRTIIPSEAIYSGPEEKMLE